MLRKLFEMKQRFIVKVGPPFLISLGILWMALPAMGVKIVFEGETEPIKSPFEMLPVSAVFITAGLIMRYVGKSLPKRR